MNKKDGGTISYWQLHTLSSPISAVKQYVDIKTDKCYVLTGTVVEDPTGRWHPGYHMKSSLVLNIIKNESNTTIETLNTIYTVIDPEGDPITGGDMGDYVSQIFY